MSFFSNNLATSDKNINVSNYALELKKVCNLNYNYTNIELKAHCSRSLVSYHLLSLLSSINIPDPYKITSFILDNLDLESFHINANTLNVLETMLKYELLHVSEILVTTELSLSIHYKVKLSNGIQQIISDLQYINM